MDTELSELYKNIPFLSHQLLSLSFHVNVLVGTFCRDLPLLARHYVMRILFVDKPVSHVVVASWVDKESHRFVGVVYTLELGTL